MSNKEALRSLYKKELEKIRDKAKTARSSGVTIRTVEDVSGLLDIPEWRVLKLVDTGKLNTISIFYLLVDDVEEREQTDEENIEPFSKYNFAILNYSVMEFLGGKQ